MSHLTKQQLTDIAKHLNQIGIKDSQFKEITADNIKEGTAIPLVILDETGNENRKITAKLFVEYLSSHLDLNKTTIVIDGVKYTLLNVLRTLLGVSENPELGYTVSSGNVGYVNVEILGEGSLSVQSALNIILNILYGKVPFPTSAVVEDIINIFSENSYIIET